MEKPLLDIQNKKNTYCKGEVKEMDTVVNSSNEIELINRDGEILVSSKEIAEHFGKVHRNVTRDINKLKDVLNFEQMFYLTKTQDSYGRKQPMYLMNRDGFTLLAMGFTGKKAMEWKLKYINAFNEMEKQLNSPELQIARALVAANEMIKTKDNQINLLTKQSEDRVKLLALAMGNNDRYIVRDIAKFYNMSSIAFNKLLNKLKVQKKVSGRWVLMKRYEGEPYMVSTTKKYYNKNHEVSNQFEFNAWTNEGLKFLYEILKRNGYYPSID